MFNIPVKDRIVGMGLCWQGWGGHIRQGDAYCVPDSLKESVFRILTVSVGAAVRTRQCGGEDRFF